VLAGRFGALADACTIASNFGHVVSLQVLFCSFFGTIGKWCVACGFEKMRDGERGTRRVSNHARLIVHAVQWLHEKWKLSTPSPLLGFRSQPAARQREEQCSSLSPAAPASSDTLLCGPVSARNAGPDPLKSKNNSKSR
jgi:hypothetical protein